MKKKQNAALITHCLSMPAFCSVSVTASGNGGASGNACAYPPSEGAAWERAGRADAPPRTHGGALSRSTARALRPGFVWERRRSPQRGANGPGHGKEGLSRLSKARYGAIAGLVSPAS